MTDGGAPDPARAPTRTTARRVGTRILLVAALGCLALVLYDLADPLVSPPDDFVAFWSAGRLLLAGGNPYDPESLLQIERFANWTKDHAYRVWEPPWTLMLLAPFAALPYQGARFAWFVVTFLLLVGLTDRLWLHYGGARSRRGAAWIVAVTFAPAILAWKTGQVSVLGLAGATAFLILERRGRLAAATATFVLLASVKPHLAYLVWIALACWIVRTRRWAAAGAAVAAVAVVLFVPLALAPTVLHDYVAVATGSPPDQRAPTLGTLVRELGSGLGVHWYGLGFLPSLVAALWLAGDRLGRRTPERWSVTMPLLLLWSLLTTPFAWIYDAVLLIVPVVRILARVVPSVGQPEARRILWTYAGINLVIVACNLRDLHPLVYFWVPPALFVWYVDADRRLRGRTAARRPGA